MKKIMLSATILLASASFVFAQKYQVVSAYNYLKNNELNDARTSINEAANNDQTKGMAKTWVYRGQIYYAIALDTTKQYNEPDALSISLESFKKGAELDSKKEYKEEIIQGVEGISFLNFNLGVAPYNNKEYEKALKHFSAVSDAYDFLNKNYNMGIVDTTAMFYGAYAATGSKKYDLAQTLYNKLLSNNYKKPEIYQGLEVIALANKDTVLALKHLEEGRKMFPDNNQLMFDELNIYLAQNKPDEVLNKLKEALAKNPTSVEINYVLGNKYDTYLKDTTNALKYYIAALKLRPEYFDALYSTGAMFYNQAVIINEQMNKLPFNAEGQKKYDQLQIARDKLFKRALAFFENAYQIDPNDRDTNLALKEIYTRLNLNDKLSALKQGTKLSSVETILDLKK